jgi:glycosyltransferase involved in cell wall biosynthesis
MNWPSVSIAFPCWNRGVLLGETLSSIRNQFYPGNLELIVVESGNDGLTESVARDYKCKYIRREREEFPVFQSITELWNACLHACTNEIVLLQCAEVQHESPKVIEDLVVRVVGGKKILATPLIKDLNQDGSFNGWYNHPREGSRPGWVSGAGPHAFRREEMLEIGGYEELFYGYGGEDNFLFYILRKNGWSVEYVESAVCAHQWHERTKYEPTTGYANRSLINILTMEIEEGKRKPLANFEPVVFLDGPDIGQFLEVLDRCSKLPMSDTFKEWAYKWTEAGMHADDIFVYQRTLANEGKGKVSEIAEMVTESVWASKRQAECLQVAAFAEGAWARRAERCADIHATWAHLSLERAKRLIREAQ